MGLLGKIVSDVVKETAKSSTIKAIGTATAEVVGAAVNSYQETIDKKKIKTTRSSEEYINQDAREVAKELLSVGFTNITLNPVKKLSAITEKETSNKITKFLSSKHKDIQLSKYGKIESISFNGETVFWKGKRFLNTTYIVIKYLDFKDSVDKEIYKMVEKITPGDVNKAIESQKKKRYCEYCKTLIVDENKAFCVNCGAPITESTDE